MPYDLSGGVVHAVLHQRALVPAPRVNSTMDKFLLHPITPKRHNQQPVHALGDHRHGHRDAYTRAALCALDELVDIDADAVLDGVPCVWAEAHAYGGI